MSDQRLRNGPPGAETGTGREGSLRASDPLPSSAGERPARPKGAEQLRAISELMAGGKVADAPDPREDAAAERQGRAESVLDGRSSREQGGDGGEAERIPRARVKPRNLHEAAEALGMEPAELYDLDIGLGDGANIKLGKLKDLHAERGGLEQEIARRQGGLDEREGAIRGAEARLAEVYEVARSAFSPGVEAQIGQWLNERNAQADAREAMALRRAMPEIADEQWRGGFENFMVKVGEDFGFSMPELMGMRDHRVFLVLRRMMDMQARLDRLLSVNPNPKDPPNVIAPQGRGGKGGNGAIARAKASGKQGDQVRAISSILRGRQ